MALASPRSTARSGPRGLRSAFAIAALAGLLASCGSTTAAPPGGAVPPEEPVPALAGATLTQLRYGAPPKADGAVVYQPDVVMLDGGGAAVRSVSANGLIWTIKGDVHGARDLAVGKILFVTGRSAGRILAVTPKGDDLDVVIGPVNLEDVVQKADFDIAQPLDLGSMLFFQAPDLPGADLPATSMDAAGDATQSIPNDASSTEPTATGALPDETTETTEPPADETTDTTDTTEATTDAPTSEGAAPAIDAPDGALRLPPVRMIAVRGDDPAGIVKGLLPIPTFGSAPAVDVGGVAISPVAGADGLGMGFDYKKNGIVLNGKAVLHLQSPKLNFKMSIDHGVKSASMSLDGAAGLTVAINAGTDVPEGGDINIQRRIEVPVDITVPIGGSVPLAVTIRQVLLFKTAFGARESAFSATGDFTFGGSFGVEYRDGTLGVTGPSGFTGTKSLVSSLTGGSLGVNGIILADQVRVIVGIGGFGFAAGPSFSFIARVGLTRSSDLGAIPCSSGIIKIEMGAGLGYSIPQPVVSFINLILKALNLGAINGTGGLEHFETLISDSEPKSGPCKI